MLAMFGRWWAINTGRHFTCVEKDPFRNELSSIGIIIVIKSTVIDRILWRGVAFSSDWLFKNSLFAQTNVEMCKGSARDGPGGRDSSADTTR